MENNKKKTTVIIAVLGILIVILCTICIMLFYGNAKFREKKKEEITKAQSETESVEKKEETDVLPNEVEQASAPIVTDLISSLVPGTIVEAAGVDDSNLPAYFQGYEISEEILSRINGQSYYENPDIGLGDLRYLKVLHYNFNHQIQVGELIVNVGLLADYQDIFKQLFENEYEIQSMYLIDNYWAGDGESSDTASIQENNTSAFCYRLITGGSGLSNHALGKAIDINPQQNPYVSYASGDVYWYHDNATEFVDRSADLPHMIDHEDLCYQIFTAHGFTWGGDWTEPKDYQHFEHE